MEHDVAIVGTGADPEETGPDGFAMAYRHGAGYDRLDDCELVACADVVRENAEAFADHHGIPDRHVYEDHEQLVAGADPDVVSVCVPPSAHAEIVLDVATAGDVGAIHCEKPMATTWGECTRMVETCEEEGVQLTIDHQRRLARPVREARAKLEAGAIGDLERLEWAEANLFDAGAHCFDLCDYFVDGAAAEWALAGVDCAEDNRWFGTLNDTRSIAQWEYENGVSGLASTADGDREPIVDAYLRLVGTDGVIEIQPDEGPPLRIRTDGGWTPIDTDGETVYGPGPSKIRAAVGLVAERVPGVPNDVARQPTHYDRAIEHVVACLEDGTEPLFSGRRAARGTELIFACYESTRRQGAVDLPLEIEDNPLTAMYEDERLRATPE